MANKDIDDFAKYLMQSIKSDFMFRVKYGRKTYSMEEVLWIVHEDIEECVLMYDYEGRPEKRKPDIRMPIKPIKFTDPDPYESTLGYTLKDVEESFNRIAEYHRNEVQDGE